MIRQAAERRGRWGEKIAALWLWAHGWHILKTRARVPMGEVDLIARRGRTLAFIEVKTRKKAADLSTAMDAYRLRRVAAAAQALAPLHARPGDSIRIDVILIAPFALPQHLPNVWHG